MMKKWKSAFAFIAAIVFLTACGGSENTGDQTQSKKTSAEGEEVTITILQTADIHSQFYLHNEMFYENEEITFRKLGGFPHLKSYFEAVRNENPDGTIIVDGGDLLQGGALSALTKGDALVPLVKNLNYDLVIPGNWEVVYQKQAMIDVMNGYETNICCANIFHEENDELVFPPYWITEKKGVKLGFIGYDDPEVPIRQNPEFSIGLKFTEMDEEIATYAKELKEQGCDLVFLVTHLGIAKQYHLANQEFCKDVDYILGNDTHERIRKPLEGKYAKLTEPGAFGSFVGRLDLTIKDGKIINENYELVEVDPEKYPADASEAKILEETRAPFKDKLDEVLGYTTTPLYRYFVVENPMDNLITDAANWKTKTDVSLSNGFRFCPPLVPGEDGKAAITYEYLWSMLPVNKPVKVGTATGQQIIDWLEIELDHVFAENPMDRFGGWVVRFSGMNITFNANAPKGERVQDVIIGGEPVQLEKQYTFSACYRDGDTEDMLCRMVGLKDTEIMEYTVHDAVVEYLKEKGTVSPTIEGRAKALDLGPNVLSQLPGTDYSFH